MKSSSDEPKIWSNIHDGRRSIGEVGTRFSGLISINSQPPSETPCQ